MSSNNGSEQDNAGSSQNLRNKSFPFINVVIPTIVIVIAIFCYWYLGITSDDILQSGVSKDFKRNEQVDAKIKNKAFSWSLSDEGIIAGKVEQVEWAPHLPFAKDLFKMREPTILKNTVVTQWRAFKLWRTPGYLANHTSLESLVNVEVGESNTFGFTDEGTALAKSSLTEFHIKKHYHEMNMSNKEFFQRINNPSDSNYYYWYGRVEGSLRRDVMPHDFIWLGSSDQDNFGLYMWLSGDDTRPPIHYDMDHNFFVHLAGTKRFVLYPPWEWANMHPYPRIHPKWHKSQCSFDDPDFELCKNYKKAKGYEALLEPGYVLYIPPYWWHHVQSVTSAVSLASWSQNDGHRDLEMLYERKLFIDTLTDPQEKKSALKAYMTLLLEEIHGEKSAEYLKNLIESRWDPIKKPFERVASLHDPKFLPSDKPGRLQSKVE